MFDFVRSHTRLLQFILVLLIFPSFVFFGVQGYSSFVDGSAKTVAVVNGVDVKHTELEAMHRQQVERMSQQMPGIDIKMLDTPAMKQQTLDALVRERVLQQASAKDHLVIGDERLRRLFATDPQYAMLRKPDGTVNAEVLAAQGMTSEIFAERLRQDFAVRQVLAGVSGSSFSAKAVESAAIEALLERRAIQLQRFETKAYLGKVQPTQAELQAYYDGHQGRFRTAEKAQIEYVVLDLESLKSQVSVSDEELRSYYNENLSRYTQAEERRASHILINAGKDEPADLRNKAKARAQALLDEVRKNPGEFEALARKNSQDPGSAQRGGDLDFFPRGAMVKPFEDAAFAMKTGEISDLVESDFGFHIIKLTAVRGGEKRPFEAVRAELLAEVSKQQAQKRYVELAEQFSNMVYEQSDSLQPVIDKFKLAKQTATVGKAAAPGATGPLASAKLLAAVFSSDAVNNKRNTEAVETGPNQLVSARIVKHEPERVQPLADVQAQVLELVRQQQASAAAIKDGQARVEALRAKPDETLPEAHTVSRTKMEGLPRAVVEAALRADLAKGPAVSGVDLGEQGYVALRVLKRETREANDPDNARAKPYVAGALADAETAAYYESLKRRFKVQVHADQIPGAAADAASSAK